MSELQTLLRLSEDAPGPEEEADIVEVYLLFCSNIMSLFEEVVKKLETNVTSSVDLYCIMDSFLMRLIQRRDDGFSIISHDRGSSISHHLKLMLPGRSLQPS